MLPEADEAQNEPEFTQSDRHFLKQVNHPERGDYDRAGGFVRVIEQDESAVEKATTKLSESPVKLGKRRYSESETLLSEVHKKKGIQINDVVEIYFYEKEESESETESVSDQS